MTRLQLILIGLFAFLFILVGIISKLPDRIQDSKIMQSFGWSLFYLLIATAFLLVITGVKGILESPLLN